MPRGYRIRVEFIDLDLESHSACRFDYVRLREGPPASAIELGRFCGSSTGTPGESVDSHSNSLTIQFKSDHVNAGKGFEVYWFAYMPATTVPSATPTEVQGRETPGTCCPSFCFNELLIKQYCTILGASQAPQADFHGHCGNTLFCRAVTWILSQLLLHRMTNSRQFS